jgi:hypothetical protein
LLASLALAACGGGDQGTTSTGSGAGGGSGGAGGSGGEGTSASASATGTSTSTATSTTGATTATSTGTGTSTAATTGSSSSTGGAPCQPGTVTACYTGPIGTENVGICKGGMSTCQADGTAGPCVGEILPSVELCATPVDDNCNGQINEGGIDCICVPGSMADCYDGPMGTEGIGICKKGTKTCDMTGLMYGMCMAEVVPAVEDCLSPTDEDCDGTAQACTGDQAWAKRFGDAMAQSASGVAAFNGGAIVTGSLTGGADFGGGLLTSAGATDVYVVSLDYLGQHQWSKHFGDVAAQSGARVAVDGMGNAYVIGDFAGKIDFGGGAFTSAGATDVFLVKLDMTGALVWAKAFGNVAAQNGFGVACDAAGNVVVTGAFAGTINFGGGALTSLGATDVFVAKLDPTGAYVWAKGFGNIAAQTSAEIAADSAGNALIAGSAAGTINFGGGALTSAGGTDIFVAKLSAGGVHLWSKLYGTAGNQDARDVTVDMFGAVLVAGDFTGSVDFGGGALASAGMTDGFIAKLDAFGAHVWSKKVGDAQAQSLAAVSAAKDGVLVGGTFAGAVNFGGGALTSAGGNDIAVAKLLP